MYKVLAILFFSFSVFAESLDMQELGQREELFNQKSEGSIKVIQKRWLDKRYLSEWSVSLSPSLRGFYYMTNYSTRLSYRLFFTDKVSVHFKYDYFFNVINQEGKDEIYELGRLPLELRHAPKNSYLLGWDWYPFYGKADFFNRIVHFDFYFSVSLGKLKLINIEDKFGLLSGSAGVVLWWHKRFNTRVELESLHYRYEALEEFHEELNYRLILSAGVLF